MSLFNPTDLAASKQAKDAGKGSFAGMDESTSVRDFLSGLGIDVEGPVTQLMQFAKQNMDKADPLNKMENIAATAPGGPAPGGPTPGGSPPPSPPPAAPGMEGLMA